MYLKRRSPLVRAAFGCALFVTACRPDPTTVTEPNLSPANATPSHRPSMVQYCEDLDDPPPDCTPRPPTEWTEYFEEVSGAGGSNWVPPTGPNYSIAPDSYGRGATCPPSFYASNVQATLFPPGQDPLTVASSGQWQMNFTWTYYWMPPGHARYYWPTGFWPSNDGSGRQAKIGWADGHCWANPRTNPPSIRVDFYKYMGVEIRRRATYDGTGGGSGGGSGNNCRNEYIIIEVDDGSGWEVWWSGYAMVCG